MRDKNNKIIDVAEFKDIDELTKEKERIENIYQQITEEERERKIQAEQEKRHEKVVAESERQLDHLAQNLGSTVQEEVEKIKALIGNKLEDKEFLLYLLVTLLGYRKDWRTTNLDISYLVRYLDKFK